jgi:hypothetical protein
MSRNEDILRAMIDGTAYTKEPQSRNEELLLELKDVIEAGGLDPDDYYTKTETDTKITEKVAEIVADAPEDFDTLKEMSDWISSHEDSAAAMNSAIQANAAAITGKVDKETGKGLSTEDYTTSEKTKLSGINYNATNIGKLYPNSTHGEIFNSYSVNRASGIYSHAEGDGCIASGSYSHAEGYCCTASGRYSHAEGTVCTASGDYSHASGNSTTAKATAQTAIGRYNLSDGNNIYAFVIGNGSSTNARSNALAVDWNGLIYVGNSATGVDVTNLVEKEQGKGLSTEDFTTAEKNRLALLSELDTAVVTIDLNSQTWTESANGLYYTGNISVTNLYRALSALITGFSALKPTDNVAVIANSDKTAIRLTASTNTFSNQANITVSVFGRFTS